MTLKITYTQHNSGLPYAGRHYAECRVLFIARPECQYAEYHYDGVIWLNVVIPSVVDQSREHYQKGKA
jgi:hypothetical protein